MIQEVFEILSNNKALMQEMNGLRSINEPGKGIYVCLQTQMRALA